MKPQQLFLGVLSVMTVTKVVSSECSDDELNKASLKFKDCMDDKKASLLQTEEVDVIDEEFLCRGLTNLSSGCKTPAAEFAKCRGHEFVDNLVAIHLSAMADILAQIHPTVDLSECPVFNTPAPVVVQVEHEHNHNHHQHEAHPQYEPEPVHEPITGAATSMSSFASIVTLFLFLVTVNI